MTQDHSFWSRRVSFITFRFILYHEMPRQYLWKDYTQSNRS